MGEFFPTHLFKERNSSLRRWNVYFLFLHKPSSFPQISFFLFKLTIVTERFCFIPIYFVTFHFKFLISSLSFCPFISKHFSPSFLVNFVAKITCLYLLGPIFYLLKTC